MGNKNKYELSARSAEDMFNALIEDYRRTKDEGDINAAIELYKSEISEIAHRIHRAQKHFNHPVHKPETLLEYGISGVRNYVTKNIRNIKKFTADNIIGQARAAMNSENDKLI
jgi:hypothetical protein